MPVELKCKDGANFMSDIKMDRCVKFLRGRDFGLDHEFAEQLERTFAATELRMGKLEIKSAKERDDEFRRRLNDR